MGIGMAVYAFFKVAYTAACVLLFSNLFLLAAAIASLPLLVRSLQGRRPLIEMTQETFWDRRISSGPIPWSGIEWRAVYAKNGSIQMNVAPEYEHLMLKSFGDGLSAKYCEMLGFPRYTVSPIATGHTTQQLEEICTRFKAPMPKRRR